MSSLAEQESIKVTDEDVSKELESMAKVAKKDIEDYSLGINIINQKAGTLHIMNWLARNPAFIIVSTRMRKELTEISEGEERDRDRAITSVYKDVWVKGDILRVNGPICDHEDKQLYALLLKELSKQHYEHRYGLVLETNLITIAKALKVTKCGKNFAKIKRSLNRLLRMSLAFENRKGQKWDGPLLTEILSKGSGVTQKICISFSHFMVTFYRLHAYTCFDGDVSRTLKGYSSAFYLFYSSHSQKQMCITVKKCKQLLAIDDSMEKKEANRRVQIAVNNLIKAGVMDAEKTFIKSGKVHTCLAALHSA